MDSSSKTVAKITTTMLCNANATRLANKQKMDSFVWLYYLFAVQTKRLLIFFGACFSSIDSISMYRKFFSLAGILEGIRRT